MNATTLPGRVMGSASVYHACSLEFDSTQELWGHCGKAVPVGTGPREPRVSLSPDPPFTTVLSLSLNKAERPKIAPAKR